MPWIDAATLDALREFAVSANRRADEAEGRLVAWVRQMTERALEKPPAPTPAIVEAAQPSAEQRALHAISESSMQRAADELIGKYGLSAEQAKAEARRMFDALDSTDTSGISMMEPGAGDSDGAFGPMLTAETN